MYATREKRDSSKGSISHHSDITELFNMLESSDDQTVEEVKILINENLTKDSWLLNGLVDFFVAAQSKRALDILVRIREPQDKPLFDKLTNCVKNESTRNNALVLLSHVVYRQPPWLYKITQHRIMNELISILKVEMDSPNLVCALLTMVSLLPMFPFHFKPYLSDLFEIFTRLAAWSTKKPSVVPEVYVLHLQVGVYNLFLRLYGLFPCNFLAYLRSFYGSRDFSEDNLQVFTVTIKPMLERVRLHPLLVTASKESEINPIRWKKMETHDVLTECAKISLDATDGSNESSGHYRGSTYGSGISMFVASSSMQDSTQFVSISSQSSTVSVTLDPGSLVNTSVTSSQETMWTPSQACRLSTPPPVQSQVDLTEPVKTSIHFGTQTSISNDTSVTLDIAQEAKPESLKNEVPTSKFPTKVHHQDSQNALPDEHQVDVAEEAQAADDRDVNDEEVSDITSKTQSHPAEEFRQTTPFCFTTQNLTDEPLAVSKSSEHLSKEPEDDVAEELGLSTETDCEIKVENFVKKLNRIRFFSHCGMPPEIRHVSSAPSPLRRSLSWPSVHQPEYGRKNSVGKLASKPLVAKTSLPPTLDSHPQACGFVSLDSSVQNETMPAHTVCSEITPIDHLIPMATSLPVKLSTCVSRSCTLFPSEQNSYCRNAEHAFHSSLSPVELLDRHLQLGSETYISQLNFIPITSTDSTNWTHFGGQPPADEIAILRKQISMLHSQLLFERHLREIHGERNRRLLGKAKWSRMQDEYSAALKDQVQLHEKENQELKFQLSQQQNSAQQLLKEKQQLESELHGRIEKLLQENSDLACANKKLQGILVSQKDSNDKIVQEFKECQSKIQDMQMELELSQREVVRCQKLEKEVTWLTKELVLLQELNQHYKDKIDVLKTPQLPEVEVDLIKDVVHSEITSLKQQLENKASQLDVAKSKISELELLQSNVKLKLSEQKQIIETMRSVHKDEIVTREERIIELCRINQQKEAHILELYHKQEMLAYDNEALKSLRSSGFGGITSSVTSAASCVSGVQENATMPKDLGDSVLT